MSQHELRALVFFLSDWRDRQRISATSFASLPTTALRYRVHGDLDLKSFLQSGEHLRDDIQQALTRVGRDLRSFHHVLDFGCGCGRTLIWLADQTKGSRLYGTDIDDAAIAWCRDHLDSASFQTNRALPPLDYATDTFDLILAISVFTHLDEEFQFRWLEELRRVTQGQGYVLLTLHGIYYWGMWPPEELEDIKSRGFAFRRTPRTMQGLFPEWYQTAYHTQDYVLANYSRYFDVRAYLPSALDECQDIVVLQKRATDSE